MGWNEKYWDIIDRYYWSPGELGLHAIAKKKWVERKGLVCVPADLVDHSGPLYTRRETPRMVRSRLEHAQEALSDLFDLTFAIASDATVASLLFRPAGIQDDGPFASFGREIAGRYGLGGDSVALPDGFFVSNRSLLGVELMLAPSGSADRLVEHLALMVLEEQKTGAREEHGLLFVAPRQDEAHFWSRLGLRGPQLHQGFVEASMMSIANPAIRRLLEEDLTHFRAIAGRLRLAMMTWPDLHESLGLVMRELDRSAAGEQTLYRLLAGFRDQLQVNTGTGVMRQPAPA